MNEIKTFEFEQKQVRIVSGPDGEPRWVAKDVAVALGYAEASLGQMNNLLGHIPEDWRGHDRIMTPGGPQKMAVLTEAGLNFFILRSDKPRALPMQRWLASEVLPAIRKTGTYSVPRPAQNFRLPTYPNALRIIADQHEKIEELHEEIDGLRIKAETPIIIEKPVDPATVSIYLQPGTMNVRAGIIAWLSEANLRKTEDGSFFETTTRDVWKGAFGEDAVFDSSDSAMVARNLVYLGWFKEGKIYRCPITKGIES